MKKRWQDMTSKELAEMQYKDRRTMKFRRRAWQVFTRIGVIVTSLFTALSLAIPFPLWVKLSAIATSVFAILHEFVHIPPDTRTEEQRMLEGMLDTAREKGNKNT